MRSCRIFLLSPANSTGKRAEFLLNPNARFELAARFQKQGASIGEVFSFLSGLYFRGKLAYARCFANPLGESHGVYVITSNQGLVPPEFIVTPEDLVHFSRIPIDGKEQRYVEPLTHSATILASILPEDAQVVLLGSVGTRKYADPLLGIFQNRLCFPADFVGRGDMSRGGLMLRCIDMKTELTYVPLAGAVLHGKRPPKLAKRTILSVNESRP